MGRKKKQQTVEEAPRAKEEEEVDAAEDSDSSEVERERGTYDIDPEICELAGAFGIDAELTQRLNDIMIEDRHKTWKQDLDRLYEILREAHTPSTMLRLKLRDMVRGKFVGKAKCGPKVRELVRKHRLDKGASTKLEEAISMREAMGKDIDKDLQLLDEHLAASNAPSKLISMKLESLRKGFNLGHCIFSREIVPGNQGVGVDGVFNKRDKRPLGYTDADLDRRFSESQGLRGGGQLMDEATVRRMMAAERKQHEAKLEKQKRSRSDSEGRSLSRDRHRKRRSRSREPRRSPSRAKRRRSRSQSPKRQRERSRSCSRSRNPKGKAPRHRS